MLNRVVLIGRLTRDPELKYLNDGTAVSNFTLAVERGYSGRDGEKPVDFIPVVAWRKLGESCAEYLGRGRLAAVSGRLQIRKRKTPERTYINPEVVAEEVKFLDWPKPRKNDLKGVREIEKGRGEDDLTPLEGFTPNQEEFNLPF